MVLVFLSASSGFLAYYQGMECWRLWKLEAPRRRTLLAGLGCIGFLSALIPLMYAASRLLAGELGPVGIALEAAVFLAGFLLFRATREEGERLAERDRRRMREEQRRREEEELKEEEIRELRSRLTRKGRELKEAREAGERLRRRVEELEGLLREREGELEELRRAKGVRRRPSPGELARMVEEGWRFSVVRVGGREYLRARRTVKGEREEKSLGPLDEGMREALRAAGIRLGRESGAGG